MELTSSTGRSAPPCSVDALNAAAINGRIGAGAVTSRHGRASRACVTDGLDNGGFGAEKIDESREGHPERLPAGSDGTQGSRGNARTGNVPNPRNSGIIA